MKEYYILKEGEKFITDGCTWGPFVDGREFNTGFIVGPEARPTGNHQGVRMTPYRHQAQKCDGKITLTD